MLNVIRSQTRKYLPIANAKASTHPTSRPINKAHQIDAKRVSTCAFCTIRPTKNNTFVVRRCLALASKMASPAVLQGKVDRFNGVLVDSTKEQVPAGQNFHDLLLSSLEEWIKTKKRGIWFQVHLDHSTWIPILVKNGFTYHHAKQDYVMLLKWLPTEESCNVPPFAHTMVGVGAVVINDDNEVLVVCEKYVDRAHWKLPGGYVEPGENFVDAAIREVYEETNIHTEFDSVLAFRHGHGGQFNCSDLYTVISLKPLSTTLKRCEREIQDCRWMKLDEYMSHPHIHELNHLFVRKFLENTKWNMKIECSHGIHQMLKKPYTVYHAIPNSNSNASNKL